VQKFTDMITLDTKRILIPTDFSITSEKAIKHGAFLAQLNKGELILLHVQKKREINNLKHYISQLRNQVEQRQFLRKKLLLLADKVHKEFGIAVSIQIAEGQVTKEIIKVATEQKIGLIVMGTEGNDSVSNLFLPSNSNRVAAHTSIPVMTVRAQSLRVGYSKILLPICLSDHSRQKVNYTLQIAKLFAAQVHVVGFLSNNDINYQHKLEIILNQIKKIANEKNVNIKSQIIKTNEPANKILSYASEISADLIVTMTDEESSFFGLTKSFDSHLIDESNIPVLSVPPEIQEESFESISIAGN